MRTLLGIVGLTILVGTVYYITPEHELAAMVAAFGALQWYQIALLFALQCVTLSLIGLQWTVLLRGSATRPVRWNAVMLRYLSANLVEALTPSSKLGGEPARVALFRVAFGTRVRDVAAASAVRALCMLVGLLLVVPLLAGLVGAAATAQALGVEHLYLFGAAGAAVAAVVIGGLLLRVAVRRFGGELPSRRVLAFVVLSGVAVWILYPLKVVVVALVAGVSVHPAVVIAATFGAYLLGLLPLTPGGLGVFEAGMFGIFTAAGVPVGEAAFLTLLSRVMTFWWPLMLSLVSGAIIFSQGVKPFSLWSCLFSCVVRCEHAAGRNRILGAVYSRLFYREMVMREYAGAGLQPGARVLQLGSGPFPITAITLAQLGCDVTAVDSNPDSLECGRRAAELQAPPAGYAGSISFRQADGVFLSYAGYDAVILALHIEPKRDVLQRIIDTATPGTRVVYRNPRSALRGAYRRVTPGELGLAQVGNTVKLPGNKEMVLLRVPATRSAAVRAGEALSCGDCNQDCEECLLSNLAPQRSATITATPRDPMLAAMGMRPGKVCSLVAVQPWGGPLVCLVGDRQVAVTRALAAQIAVAPLAVTT